MEKKTQGTDKTSLLDEYKQLAALCNKLNHDIDELTRKIHDHQIDQKLWKQNQKIFKKSNQNCEIVHYFAQKNLIPIIEKLQNQRDQIEKQIQKASSHYSSQKIYDLQQEVNSYYVWINSSQNDTKKNDPNTPNENQDTKNSNEINDTNNINDINDNNSDSSLENNIELLEKQIQDEVSKKKSLEKDLQEEIDKIQERHIFEDPSIISLEEELLSEKQKYEQTKKAYSKLILKQKLEISDHQRQIEEQKHIRLQKFLAEQAALEKNTVKPKIYHPTPNSALSSKNDQNLNPNHNIATKNNLVSHNQSKENQKIELETSDENSNKTSFQSHLDVSDENTNKTSFQSHLDVSDENTNKTNINQHMKITKKVNSKTSRLTLIHLLLRKKILL